MKLVVEQQYIFNFQCKHISLIFSMWSTTVVINNSLNGMNKALN